MQLRGHGVVDDGDGRVGGICWLMFFKFEYVIVMTSFLLYKLTWYGNISMHCCCGMRPSRASVL